MIANLDMNSQRIINTLDGVDPQDTVSFSQLSAVVAGGLPVQTGNAGLFLTTNGSVTSWASTLPDQTGNAGFFLTTDGSTPSWAVGSFLPALVTNRLLSNDGATASWRLDFLLTTNSLAGDDANAGALLNEVASATNPTLVPDKANLGDGLGSNGVGTVSLIAASVEQFRAASAGNITFQDLTANIASGPAFLNEISTSINPTLIPNRSDLTIGVGGVSATSLDMIVLGSQKMSFGTAVTTFLQNVQAANAAGPAIVNEVASASNPTLIPERGELTTGIGKSAAGTLTAIGGSQRIVDFLASAGNGQKYMRIQTGDDNDVLSRLQLSMQNSGGVDSDADFEVIPFNAGAVIISNQVSTAGTRINNNSVIADNTVLTTATDLNLQSFVGGNVRSITLSTFLLYRSQM